MAQLVFLHEGKAIPYSVSSGDTVVGRHPDCDIQLRSDTVSRHHAKSSGTEGQFYVEDLGSGNGTFVNGQKIESRTAIGNQDRVKFGPLLLPNVRRTST